jgi:hypothetical protein
VNRNLCIVINSRWPEVISHHNLWEKMKDMKVDRHTLRKPNDIKKAALEGNPQGTRKRGHPRTVW